MKKNDIYETIVFGWIIQGMSTSVQFKNELERVKSARSLLKKLKEEYLAEKGLLGK